MVDLSLFDENQVGNPNNNIFGLPFSEEDAALVLVPVPWEVTVSYGAGTARAAEHIFKASLQVDLYDLDYPDNWRQGIYMRAPEKKIMLKSDFLRKEAELYIDFISKGEDLTANKFMCKSLKDVNEGGRLLNQWVFEQTKELMNAGKLVGLVGGDHSTALGYWKAIAEKHGKFGILQIDAHADLRPAYQKFTYSHASVTYNGLNEIPELERVVQLGVRDLSHGEWDYICNSNFRVVTYFDREIRNRLYEGDTWRAICHELIEKLPEKVYVSFDIDGLDPKLCPNTGTPVQGGLEADQVNYLLRKIKQSGRQILGFDLVEVGLGENNWDANVGARELWKLCNILLD
ncbi:MAG: agmatinase [Bacteroidetes bacterium]|nr:MAG: agmatinase [Bacteroidota bacterium]